MQNKKISVIIPVKNGAATLQKNLESIKSQTISNDIEIIILDSQSTDSSIEICSKFNVKIFSIATP